MTSCGHEKNKNRCLSWHLTFWITFSPPKKNNPSRFFWTFDFNVWNEATVPASPCVRPLVDPSDAHSPGRNFCPTEVWIFPGEPQRATSLKPIGSMYGILISTYTWMVYFYGFHVGKYTMYIYIYTIHESYGKWMGQRLQSDLRLISLKWRSRKSPRSLVMAMGPNEVTTWRSWGLVVSKRFPKIWWKSSNW